MNRERNCLSYWFPRLQAANVPVPRTEIVRTDCTLLEMLDGKRPAGLDVFLAELSAAANRIGSYPLFLRTGQGSGKHQWKRTCFLRSPDDLEAHVAALVEWSETVDFLGLPSNVWAVRELLPVKPAAILDAYGDMPLVPELRYFVRGGEIVCGHSYWPAKAICQGFAVEPENIATIISDSRAYFSAAALGHQRESQYKLVEQVAEAFADDGAWSVDVLATLKGWYITDMAEMDSSWHWPGCANAKKA